MKEKYSVLFVCLGNICRSPLGEGIFRSLLDSRGIAHSYMVDSCGTGSWHVGSKPHRDSVRIAREHGVDISTQRARQLQSSDLASFDLIVAMDRENRRAIYGMSGSNGANVICLREYDREQGDLDVPDPYYGGPEGFQAVFDIIFRSCERLVESLESERALRR